MSASPCLLPLVIGTSGHVDHGKTSLIRHLTGSETDSSKEEQKRGLTITPGFSSFMLSDQRIVGVVDVPGHSDFIKNMIAGATAQDLLLLIVAANDGIMPQTVEHLQIAKLLKIPQLMVVITKIDLVSQDTLPLVKEEISDFLNTFGYANVPIMGVSNQTGEGLAELRQEIEKQVNIALKRRENFPLVHLPFRMNIQRKFLVPGLGMVVTGIPVSGKLHVGEAIEILPSGKQGRIRGIQNYHHTATSTLYHACNGINITGIDNDDIERGMTLGVPGIYQTSTRITIKLLNISDKPIKHEQFLRFHSGTMSVNAMIILLSPLPIQPNQEGFAQLILDHPLIVLAGDCFVLRSASPSQTVAGGKILSIQPTKFNRRKNQLFLFLEQAAQAIEDDNLILSELLLHPSPIFKGDHIGKLVALTSEQAQEQLAPLVAKQKLFNLGHSFYLIKERSQELRQRVSSFLNSYHEHNPQSWGAPNILIARFLQLPDNSGHLLCQALIQEIGDCFEYQYSRLRLHSFSLKLSPVQQRQQAQLLHYIRSQELKIPPYGNTLKDLNLQDHELKFLIKIATETHRLIQIDNYIWDYQLFQKFQSQLISFCKNNPNGIVLNQIREITGLTRNPAFSLLGYLLKENILFKNGDKHFLTSRYL